jgi:hypothetical protein
MTTTCGEAAKDQLLVGQIRVVKGSYALVIPILEYPS